MVVMLNDLNSDNVKPSPYKFRIIMKLVSSCWTYYAENSLTFITKPVFDNILVHRYCSFI